MSDDQQPKLKFAHNVIEHLGIKLYRNKTGNVLAELLANCWDADATWVDILIDPAGGDNGNGCIAIFDDGSGMDFQLIKDHYLHVGKPKRRKPNERSPGGRRPMGRKGLGKLAPFGIARIVDVVTIKAGLINWFTLDLETILKKGSDGSYPPVFQEQDLALMSSAAGDDEYVASKVNEFRERLIAEDKDSGTAIFLRSINANQFPQRPEVAQDLGARFTVVLLRDDFVVRVNDQRLTHAEALPEFEFRIPEGDGTSIEMVEGKEVKFWVGFVERAEWSSDEAGVGVFAHGKIAQARPYFFNKKGKEVFQRYLYAVVEADWLDEAENDLISTDRTSIDWSVDELQPLYKWGQKKVSSWITRYEAFRKDRQDQEVRDQADELRKSKAVNTYSAAENEQIVSLVSDATREIGKTKSAEAAREQLLIAVSKAWINQPTREFLGSLWDKLRDTSSSPEQITAILSELSFHSVPEKMGLALTFSQRAFALSVLYELVHRNAEPDLQKLVSEFPWILEPRGDLLTADKTLKTTTDRLAMALKPEGANNPGLVIKGMTERQRADFVFLTSPDKKMIRIAEIKKPRLPMGKEEVRQLQAYLDYVEEAHSGSTVEGLLVGNKAGVKNTDSRIEVKGWDEILSECRAIYVEMVASMIEIADVQGGDTRLEIIRDFGGDATWELLTKLSETDENLKILIGNFEKQSPSGLPSMAGAPASPALIPPKGGE
ncbi:hypothetical protein HKD42_11850 [Altererythrobacter sp. RZ02]|uniref:Histidine kinase/DNA gyrase B/HSP90-like ATPase n=1 Tax=Pontixanthobacter rizhaonensis TaxID=2730337 RepID=A0A848QTH2_9SPHN|nr:ATP-binding protein [Pontixanthobacter rizhaonensis]NMW32756.1 hypothetical protein [Pontixanthobacter rizhaonensis]